jgi:DNA gyrase subunit B
MRQKSQKEAQDINQLITILKLHFVEYDITLQQTQTESNDGIQAQSGSLIVFRRLSKQWTVSVAFFASEELVALHNCMAALALFEDSQWKLSINGKDKYEEGQGILFFINTISTLSKPYMSVQRYKGLGEMNPEQLWETSMNSETRTLLKVTVEDGLAADFWFVELMGDKVQGRKDYIEQYGQFAKNLDV